MKRVLRNGDVSSHERQRPCLQCPAVLRAWESGREEGGGQKTGLLSCLLSFPASGSFVMSWLFASGGQTVGVSHYILRSHLVFSVFENGLKLVPSLPQRAK